MAQLSYWSLRWNVNKSRMNTCMSAQHGWTPCTLGSELPVGITTATTIIINPIVLNHNLSRVSWWVCQYACSKHQGEWRGNQGSKPSLVGIDTLTKRVEPQSKVMGTGSWWSASDTQSKTTIVLTDEQFWNTDGQLERSPGGYLSSTRWIRQSLMLVYSGSTSQKERYWYNPNSRRGLRRGHSWPPRPSLG